MFTVAGKSFESWAGAKAATIRLVEETGQAQPLHKEGRTEPYWFHPREKTERPAKAPNPYVVRLEQAELLIAQLSERLAALEAKPKRTTRKAA